MRRTIRLIPAICMGCLGTLPAPAQFPLLEITTSGNVRLTQPELAQASGLTLRQPVEQKDFDQAVQKLMSTGMLQSLSYRYTPKQQGATSGYSLTFVIMEAPAQVPIELDL